MLTPIIKRIYLLEIDSIFSFGAVTGRDPKFCLSSIKENDLLNFTTSYYHYFRFLQYDG